MAKIRGSSNYRVIVRVRVRTLFLTIALTQSHDCDNQTKVIQLAILLQIEDKHLYTYWAFRDPKVERLIPMTA